MLARPKALRGASSLTPRGSRLPKLVHVLLHQHLAADAHPAARPARRGARAFDPTAHARSEKHTACVRALKEG
eukprot:4506491-Pleurochrysis_carterae.AAC.6